MKTVQGVYRQYQLVEKTKRKDLDGIVYLVAGERNLWVKLLKVRSASKRDEIAVLISRGASSGFEKPLEIINDNKGFAGYTFRGPEMEIVPEKEAVDKSNPPKKNGTPNFGNMGDNQANDFAGKVNLPPIRSSVNKNIDSSISKAQQLLIVGAVGTVMFVLTLIFIDTWLIQLIYISVSETAGRGCELLSFGGILPSIGGVAILLLYRKSFEGKVDSIPIYTAFAILAFLCGEAVTYGIIGVLCVLVTSIFGVVQAYQSVIVMIIVLVILVGSFIPKRK